MEHMLYMLIRKSNVLIAISIYYSYYEKELTGNYGSILACLWIPRVWIMSFQHNKSMEKRMTNLMYRTSTVCIYREALLFMWIEITNPLLHGMKTEVSPTKIWKANTKQLVDSYNSYKFSLKQAKVSKLIRKIMSK